MVDLKTEAILAAPIYTADEADTATLVKSLEQAQANVDATESGRTIEKAAVLGNRARTQRAYGNQLQRRRSELVERSFAHVCDTGGSRRTWLRGLENVRKRHLVAAAAHNLGLILRKLLGAGKSRAYDDLLRALESLYFAQLTRRLMLSTPHAAQLSRRLPCGVAAR